MRVFIAMKVPRGDAQLAALAHTAAQAVLAAGHEPFLATEEILTHGLSDPHAFMPFVRTAMSGAHTALVLYHSALRGGLIELGLAYAAGLPILLAHPAGEQVSSSALGCADHILAYHSLDDLHQQIVHCLTA